MLLSVLLATWDAIASHSNHLPPHLLVPIVSALRAIKAESLALLESDRLLESDARLRRRLADVWLHCARLDPTGTGTLKLALHVPPLVGLGPVYLLTLETVLQRRGQATGDTAATQYLHAVETLEVARARQGDTAPFLAYLLDDELAAHPLLPAVVAVGHKALEAFVAEVGPQRDDAAALHHATVKRHVLAVLQALQQVSRSGAVVSFFFSFSVSLEEALERGAARLLSARASPSGLHVARGAVRA